MECVIGIKMNDFVLLAADMRCAHSILTLKHDERKMYKFSNRVLAAVCGESGDTSHFAEYIQQNMQLYEIRNVIYCVRQVPFAVHGYGSMVALSILDRMHRPDMTVTEAVELLRSCIQEVQKRLVINLDRYMVRIVTKDGIEELPDLTDFAVKA
ncbi:unnamed protein product [Trichobilharzia regenti]|nr:unnamed protein product [Trichobilharzia regenti]